MGSLVASRSCKTDPADIVTVSTAPGGDGQQDKKFQARRIPQWVSSHQMVTRDPAKLNTDEKFKW